LPDKLTIERTRTADGYSFVRSDGERFFMLLGEDGSASLYAGTSPDKPPSIDMVGFDRSVQDKIAAAKRWILAYPERPSVDRRTRPISLACRHRARHCATTAAPRCWCGARRAGIRRMRGDKQDGCVAS